MLQRDLGLEMTVAIEDLAGTVHLAYGADRRRAAGAAARLSLSETLWSMERLDKKPQ